MKVNFNVIDEYLAELKARKPLYNLVRITQNYDPHPIGFLIRVHVIVGHVNEQNELVECIHRVGDCDRHGTEEAKKVIDQGDTLFAETQLKIKEMGFEVGNGRYLAEKGGGS